MNDTPFGLSAILPSPLDWITYYLLCFGLGLGIGLGFLRISQTKWAMHRARARRIIWLRKEAMKRKPVDFYVTALDGEEIPAGLWFEGFRWERNDEGKRMLFARWSVHPPRPGMYRGMGCRELPSGASIMMPRGVDPDDVEMTHE